MKILIISQFFYPEIGAAASRLSEMCRGLKEHGWDVKVITAMPNYPKGEIDKKYKGIFRKNEMIDGIPVSRFWLYPSNSKKLIPRLFSMFSLSITTLFSVWDAKNYKPDYVLVSSPPLLLSFTGLIISKIIGSKFVLNIADIWPLTALQLGAISEGKLFHLFEKMERYLYRKADICIGQTNGIVNHLNKQGAQKTQLFMNGVDIYRFKNITNGHIPKTPRIIYAGNIGVAQGLLDLCRKINFNEYNVELHIYGEGTERKGLQKFLELNPGRNVFLHNSVGRDEIPQILKQHECSLIPLYKNIPSAVPSKLFDAMAAGIPILFIGDCEGAKIVEENSLGWISHPGNIEEFEKNLSDFAHNSDKSKLFGKNGEKVAKQIYDREIQIENLHSALLENISDFQNN